VFAATAANYQDVHHAGRDGANTEIQ